MEVPVLTVASEVSHASFIYAFNVLIGNGAHRQVAMHRLMCSLLLGNRVNRKLCLHPVSKHLGVRNYVVMRYLHPVSYA